MFVYLVMAALVAHAAVGEEAQQPADAAKSINPGTTSVGWASFLGCAWEDDAVSCLRDQSARALKEIHSHEHDEEVKPKDDDSILDALQAGTSRMIEYLSKDDEEPQGEDAKAEESTDSQGRAIEEGRKKIKIGKLGKKGKKGGGLLQTFYMLKMMFGMIVSMKVGLLSFLLQVKTFFISLIFVTIAVIQFFWKLQEKKSHGGFVSPGGWDSGSSSFGGYPAGPAGGSSGGWDKRAWSEQAHRAAYSAQAPAS